MKATNLLAQKRARLMMENMPKADGWANQNDKSDTFSPKHHERDEHAQNKPPVMTVFTNLRQRKSNNSCNPADVKKTMSRFLKASNQY